MNPDQFWITDLRGARDIEIAHPLSAEADSFLREVNGLRTSRVNPDGRRIECRAHDDDPRLAEFRSADGRVHNIWMYVQWHTNRWRLCHYEFDRADVKLADHVLAGPETPAHRMLKDTWQQALEEGGCDSVDQEQTIGSRRYDVLATLGQTRIAIECDHTTRGWATAKAKAATDEAAGLSATLFCADRPHPGYRYRVAHTEVNELHPRNGRPHPRHQPVVRGPRALEFAWCRPGGEWSRCPYLAPKQSGYRYCGREHPVLRPFVTEGRSLSVADVGEQVPAGDLVVARPNIKRVNVDIPAIEVCILRAADARALADYQRDEPKVQGERGPANSRHQREITAEQMSKRIPSPRKPRERRSDVHAAFAAAALLDQPGVMRALWWSVCRGCDSRIGAGEVVGLADTPTGRAWVCGDCLLAAPSVPPPRQSEPSTTTPATP